MRYEVEDFRTELQNAASDKLKIQRQNLEILTNRLSPLKLASKLSEKKIRLALLEQRQISAVRDIADKKDEQLKIEMASLDALSPLAVLKRGFSIVQTPEGKILRDAEKIKQNDRVKIRLSRGRIEAEVKLIEN